MTKGYEAGAVKALQSINGCYPHVTLLILHNTLGVITCKSVFYCIMCKSIQPAVLGRQVLQEIQKAKEKPVYFPQAGEFNRDQIYTIAT